MKNRFYFGALIISLSISMACLTAEAADASNALAQDISMNPAVGHWEEMGTAGSKIIFPSMFWFLYPDGTVSAERINISAPIDLQEDGSFTVDLSAMEEYADYTVSGEVMPVSKDDLKLYGVKEKFENVSYDTRQLILTVSHQDRSNPLAPETSISTVLFLPRIYISNLLKNYIFGKTWKSGENVLEIDSKGHLVLNDGAYTADISFSSYNNGATPIHDYVTFRWPETTVKYLPVSIAKDRIEFQNIDKPKEILVLERVDDEVTASEESTDGTGGH